MARLHEYQAKALLAEQGIAIPRGRSAAAPEEAAQIATEIGGPVVVKIQAWTTGRAAIGGVKFADSPGQTAAHAETLLAMTVGNFPVERVLVEERLDIAREFFVSLFISDAGRSPVILFAASGGTGIEQRASEVRRLACEVAGGPGRNELDDAVAAAGADAAQHDMLVDALRGVFELARRCDARSIEINPLVVTTDGRVVAADCRMTIDDYAVFRHPELGIDIARELDHPPTALERAAYQIEQDDHRGTFYFAQLNTEAKEKASGTGHRALEKKEQSTGKGGPSASAGSLRAPEEGIRHQALGIGREGTDGGGLIGFHGAGGGGSMMSMDAIVNQGFTVANFCDTSGNPSAAKVYRAARIILHQPGLVGYFGSGSGVASQEQIWSAYGLAKAFWELELDIPALIRLGGNSEDRAVQILESVRAFVPATIEGYRKDDSPRFIAGRFAELVAASDGVWRPRAPRRPGFVGTGRAIAITGGRVWIDGASSDAEAARLAARHSFGLLKAEASRVVLAVSAEQAQAKDSEFIACEVELRRAGTPILFVELDMPEMMPQPAGDA